MFRRFTGFAVLSLLGIALVGCGSGGPTLAPVKGKVTYRNEPVSGATVSFVPVEQGQPAIGVTDAAGQYTLNTTGKAGAGLGKYRVSVTKRATSGDTTTLKPEDMMKMQTKGKTPEAKSEIPQKYAAAPTSGLEATVTADASKNVFDFELKD